jgi:hypothetical protein
VAKTGSEEDSYCYVDHIVCPDCGAVIYDHDSLMEYGDNEDVRHNLLNRPDTCLFENEGGCWTAEKESKGETIVLKPVYGCMVHDGKDGAELCPEPEPLDPLMGPIHIEREGEKAKTRFNLDFPKKFRSNLKDWVNYKIPPEIQEAFDGAPVPSTRIPVLGLEAQAELFDIDFPFDDEALDYGAKTDDDDDKGRRGRGRRSKRGGRSDRNERDDRSSSRETRGRRDRDDRDEKGDDDRRERPRRSRDDNNESDDRKDERPRRGRRL